MKHRKAFRKLGRTPAHRRSLLRNLANALIINGRIETTLPKAKELKRVADKLITLGKKNSLHARRQAMSFLYPINRTASGKAKKLTAVHTLFEELAPKFAEREGGYTRVIRTRFRDGDKAQMALIEFVEGGSLEKKTKRRRRQLSTDFETEAEAGQDTQAAEA